ncbi:MAG TPA: OmpA family protein [Gammaproteobacteria bacterium]|nr:OmpA family protein [Gammaproteobacteria bacterium]
MNQSRTLFVPLQAAGMVFLTLVAGTALAESRGTTPGYTADSAGNIVTSGSGDCVHTGSWSKDEATVVGCDGYVLNAKVRIIKGEGLDAITLITYPQAELFAFDKAELSDAGKAYIREHRDELGGDLAKVYSITVIGYTDSTGDAKYNLGLSERRAQAVRDYLVSLGVPADKMRVLGRGENDPIAPNDSKEGRARNRRVEVIVVAQPRALDAMIFPSVALFERRSGELSAQGIQLLEKNISDAREQLKRATYIEVVGHTDDVGDDEYNQQLSEQRAQAVARYLVRSGVDAGKIVAMGAGERLPVASNATEEGRAENRRVEVLVLGRAK